MFAFTEAIHCTLCTFFVLSYTFCVSWIFRHLMFSILPYSFVVFIFAEDDALTGIAL
jgi:hypothetical protein